MSQLEATGAEPIQPATPAESAEPITPATSAETPPPSSTLQEIKERKARVAKELLDQILKFEAEISAVLAETINGSTPEERDEAALRITQKITELSQRIRRAISAITIDSNGQQKRSFSTAQMGIVARLTRAEAQLKSHTPPQQPLEQPTSATNSAATDNTADQT